MFVEVAALEIVMVAVVVVMDFDRPECRTLPRQYFDSVPPRLAEPLVQRGAFENLNKLLDLTRAIARCHCCCCL